MSVATGNYLFEEIKKNDQDHLLKEFKKFGFSAEITSEARKIWAEINIGTQKQGKRSKLYFFCFYVAHIQLKVVQDHEYIAEKVGISTREAVRSFIDFSETKTGFKIPFVEFKVSDFLDMYIPRLGLEADTEEIIKIYNELIDAPDSFEKKHLLRKKPQNVAAAILDYYKSQKYARMKDDEFKLLYKKKETIHTVKTELIQLIHSN